MEEDDFATTFSASDISQPSSIVYLATRKNPGISIRGFQPLTIRGSVRGKGAGIYPQRRISRMRESDRADAMAPTSHPPATPETVTSVSSSFRLRSAARWVQARNTASLICGATASERTLLYPRLKPQHSSIRPAPARARGTCHLRCPDGYPLPRVGERGLLRTTR